MAGRSAEISLRGPAKVLLICAGACEHVRRSLAGNGCSVETAADGGGAVARVMREFFDAAVVVSTGMEMDLAETVLNLRDVNDSMRIVIVADRVGAGKGVIENLVGAVPNTAALTLERLLDSLRDGPRRE